MPVFVSGLKPLLPQVSFRVHPAWGELFRAEDLVSIVLSRLKAIADSTYGPVDRAVLGYPVMFETNAGGEEAFGRLASAAELAGFSQSGSAQSPSPRSRRTWRGTGQDDLFGGLRGRDVRRGGHFARG